MGVTHSSGFGQPGDAPQTSQELLEQCLAFSKDSPLGMDLSWIFLGFSFPSFAKPCLDEAQQRPRSAQTGITAADAPLPALAGEMALKPTPDLCEFPVSLAAGTGKGFGIPSPTTNGSRTEPRDMWLCRCQAKPLSVAEAVSNLLWSSSLWLSLLRKRWWDNGRV